MKLAIWIVGLIVLGGASAGAYIYFVDMPTKQAVHAPSEEVSEDAADEQKGTTTQAASSPSPMTSNPAEFSTMTKEQLVAEFRANGMQMQQLNASLSGAEPSPEVQKQFEALWEKSSTITKLLEEKYNENGVEIGLQVEAHSYDVTIKLNGTDIGTEGGSSYGGRYFNKEHFMYDVSTPSVQQEHTLLKEGVNEIEITYKKTDTSSTAFDLEVTVFAYKPAFDLLTFKTDKESGTVKGTFTVGKTKPADATTVVIPD